MYKYLDEWQRSGKMLRFHEITNRSISDNSLGVYPTNRYMALIVITGLDAPIYVSYKSLSFYYLA